jgi:hypothetical protein
MDIAEVFIAATINALEANKRLADRAVAQVPDEKLHVPLDGNTNSIAVIMKHVAGNLESRWTDFLTTDGEKPDRNRDDEFVDTFYSRADVLDAWERGWACLMTTLKALTGADCGKTVLIRGEPHTVKTGPHSRFHGAARNSSIGRTGAKLESRTRKLDDLSATIPI